MESIVRVCNHCGEADKALRSCGRCKTALYCNRNCQSEDWTKGGHKQKCIKEGEEKPRAEFAASEIRGRVGDTNFARLPVIDFKSVLSNISRETVVPQPPCTMVMTLNGLKVGWILVLDVSKTSARKLNDVLSAVVSGHYIDMMQGRGEAFRLLSQLTAPEKTVFHLMMGLYEYSRRFVLKDVPPGESQMTAFSRVEQRPSDGAWVIPANSATSGFNRVYEQVPCSMPGGNQKHCMNTSSSGRCPRGCMVAGCKLTGACLDIVSASIWCHKCDMARYCSVACKKEDRDNHKSSLCDSSQHMRRTIGFSRVCHQCGIPDSADGTQLRLCGKCKQALFCSKECAAASWTSGHRLECVAGSR